MSHSLTAAATGKEINTNENAGFLSHFYLLFLLFRISQAVCQRGAGTMVPLNKLITLVSC